MESVRAGSLRVTKVVGDRWDQNAYLLHDEEVQDALIIDPGPGTAPQLIEELGSAHLRGIVCTHGHYDHLGAAADLARQTGAICRVHERDSQLAQQAPLYALSFEGRTLTLPDRIESFSDSDRFAVGGHSVVVVPCPGHTPGSVAFLVRSLLFTGDTILRFKLGRTDLPGGDSNRLMRSVSRLLAQVETETTILAGHGLAWNVAEARAWLMPRPATR